MALSVREPKQGRRGFWLSGLAVGILILTNACSSQDDEPTKFTQPSSGTGGTSNTQGQAGASGMAGQTGNSGSAGKTGAVTVSHVVTGMFHTCALLDTGKIRCWGSSEYGQLGYGHTNNIGDDETPASAGDVNVGGNVLQIAAGNEHTCALLDTGKIRCWGGNDFGQLGYGNTNTIGDDETPATAGDLDVGGNIIQITASFRNTCALLDTGNVRCWGWNQFGQLGYGNKTNIGDNETPASAGDVNVGGKVLQITAGGGHTCTLLDTSNVRCWGYAGYGQLGYGNKIDIGDNETPASAGDVNVGGKVLQITSNDYNSCALLDTGNVRCWGSSEYGQLGYGNTNTIGDDESPASAGDVQVVAP
jgi:alpha-tubulin suppressor-like RCC1 family protein